MMRGMYGSQGIRVQRAALIVAVLTSLILTLAGPAQAARIVGTNGSDRLVGTARADVIKARGGNDRVKGGRGRDRLWGGRGRDRLWGGRGRDRLWGGRGADRLNAVDGLRDRVVNGGPGKDVCRVDPADRPNVKGCETVQIVRGGGPRGGRPGAPAPGAPAPGAPAPGAGVSCATPPEEARFTG